MDVPFGVKGDDVEVDGLRVKDDVEVFGRGVHSVWSSNSDLARTVS